MSVERRGGRAPPPPPSPAAGPTFEDAAQSLGCDPKAASKRNSGLFAFLRWFRPASSRESLPASSSSSSSSAESLDSSHSAGTVASFAYVPPHAYEGTVSGERVIAPGPETDTYRARLRQRDRRRERDKDLTLRKKYNLFLHVDTVVAATPAPEDNTHSLPLMTRTSGDEDPRVHRRTNSESSKGKRAGAYLHVKGKRKAPQPPARAPGDGETSTASLRRRKRLAPPLPDKEPDVICNDSLKLDHGVLKPVKETESENNPPSAKSYVSPGASPRPWYKRHSASGTSGTASKSHKPIDDKYEPIEVQFKRNSTLDLTLEEIKTPSAADQQKRKEEKRKSGVSYLANISELDREAGEIIKNRDQNNVQDMPEFMRPKDTKNDAADSWVSPKRRSAKDLIAKFNAITNVTKVTVFGASQKDARLFGKQTSLDETKRRQESLLESHRKRLEEIDRKNTPLLKSESASAIKPKPETPKLERKNWKCPKCNLENEYWRIICHVCSAIKPYFDDFSSSPKGEKDTSSPLTAKKEVVQRSEVGFERSRTQIGFSALAGNRNRSAEAKSDTPKKRNDEREKLKKMLIEMKNSLPKRKSNILLRQSRASVIVENPENNPDKPIETPQKEPEKTQEEKVAEILIGTQTKIYENIKVRRLDHPSRPPKVSSSAQTSGILKQTTQKPKEYEPMRPKDFEEIYSDSNSQSRIYANLARNDELSIFFNMPKGKVPAAGGSRNATDTIEINRLLRRLETAIGKGDLGEAAAFAKELAQLKVNCSVVRQKPSPTRTAGGRRGIQIEMYVEDKVSHRGPFPLEVLPTQTVAQLKLQVQKEFEIPAEYQRWILGKELVTNEDSTLKDHDVNSEGCPVFLYLVAPDSKVKPEKPKEKGIPPSTSKVAEKRVEEQNGLEKVRANVQNLQKILRENRRDSDHVPKIVNVIPKPAQEAKVVSVQRAEVKTATVIEVKVEAPSLSIVMEEATKPDQKPKQQQVEAVTKPIVPAQVVAGHQVASAQAVVGQQVALAQAVAGQQVALAQAVAGQQVASAQAAPVKVVSTSDQVAPAEDVRTNPRPSKEWECHLCTLLNPVSSNVCAACASVRLRKDLQPKKKRAPQPRNDQTYLQLMDLDNTDLVGNVEPFECLVCFMEVTAGEGVTLRECLHQFCRACLAHTVEFNEEAEVKCPYRDDEYSCNIALQDREIKALVSSAVYEQHLAKSVAQAENKIDKSFHCKTPDCKGWCIFEDNVNEFRCPVCRRTNCLTCQAVHMGMNCKQYQEKMNEESEIDDDARRTRDMLEGMVRDGEAIECPTCRVVLMKKWGCDWLRCSMCKTEICWVTRGPRWGPAGKGDTSGGCQCGLNGAKCHPKCNYCH